MGQALATYTAVAAAGAGAAAVGHIPEETVGAHHHHSSSSSASEGGKAAVMVASSGEEERTAAPRHRTQLRKLAETQPHLPPSSLRTQAWVPGDVVAGRACTERRKRRRRRAAAVVQGPRKGPRSKGESASLQEGRGGEEEQCRSRVVVHA